MTKAERTLADFDLRPGSDETTSLAMTLKGVQFVILFGSAAAGRLRDDSDIDLAVMFPRPLRPGLKIELAGRLSRLFAMDVDLLDLRTAGPIIKMQVLRFGRPWLIQDQSAFEEFRMRTPTEYFDFKLSRRPIEEQILSGGEA